MDNFDYNDYLKNNPLLTESVQDKWPTMSDDDKIDLLTGVWDDADEAEKHFEKEWQDLPDAARENMRLDMLREEDETLEESECECGGEGECKCNDKDPISEDSSSLFREKQMVMKQLLSNMQQIASDNPEELTRGFLEKLKGVIDDLIISDF